MTPKNIPDDINAEVLLSYFPEGSCKVKFNGPHNRNAYNDLLELEETREMLLLTLGRASLYNNLPEMMFHSVDRFDNLPAQNEKERFEEECDALQSEIDNAHQFFAPIDLMLLRIRMTVREQLEAFARTDRMMIDILGDELTETQRQNRFVKQLLPFLPFCKTIRGDKTAITLMLRKVFKEEGLTIKIHEEIGTFTDPKSRYDNSIGCSLQDLYVGNTFNQPVTAYDINYWPEEEFDEQFEAFLEDLEIARQFIQDYFMAMGEILHFNVSHQDDWTYLADENKYYYLNYNTYL